jgi:HK97 gp10 family phage protein
MARARAPRLVTGRTMYNVQGLEEVRQLLEILQKEAPQIYKEELESAGTIIKNSAKSKVHNISGALNSSINTKSKFTETKQQVSVIAGGRAAPHAHLVEFGHRQINKNGEVVGDVPAHPFLRTAFEEYRETLLQKLSQAINRLTSR